MVKIQTTKQNPKILSWAVFSITICLVLISLVSVVFPALIIRTFSPIDTSPVDPWQMGPMAFNLIFTNLIIFGLAIAYHKNKLPLLITKTIQFLFRFEVSKKIAFIVIMIMLGIYIFSSIGELAEEERGFDYPLVLQEIQNWNISDFPPDRIFFRYLLLSISTEFFDNIRIIPYIATISLVILTYFFTLEMSQKRFAGLVAIVILLQSFIFLKYDTRSTYENFWTLFYLLSLYLIYKSWQFSAISFVLSVFSKPLSTLFLPMTLFFIYNSNLSRKKKIYVGISYLIIIAIGLGILTLTNFDFITVSDFDKFNFWQGFTAVATSLRFDYLLILLLLPLTVGLFFVSRQGIIMADSIMVLIAGILFSAPLLTGLTEFTNQPYRFIPLVVFFAMGVGLLLSKKEQKIIQEA